MVYGTCHFNARIEGILGWGRFKEYHKILLWYWHIFWHCWIARLLTQRARNYDGHAEIKGIFLLCWRLLCVGNGLRQCSHYAEILNGVLTLNNVQYVCRLHISSVRFSVKLRHCGYQVTVLHSCVEHRICPLCMIYSIILERVSVNPTEKHLV